MLTKNALLNTSALLLLCKMQKRSYLWEKEHQLTNLDGLSF